MDTKLMLATNVGDVKKLKNKEDAMATVESSKKPSEDQPRAANIAPLLLASARVGSWEALNFLLEREDTRKPVMVIPTPEFRVLLARGSSAQGRVDARDVEEGVEHQPAAAASVALLKGVTPDGDTALHAVATSHKGGQHFLKYAGIIYDRDSGILYAKNHRGDTPLHCAARAGNSKMVSHLIDLAAREGPDTKLRLLRMENRRHETALHEAIRFQAGSILGHKERPAFVHADPAGEENNIVKLLMGADPELANYPADGVSPLYLAILLGKSTIALTLYDKSGGNLSYSGADRQNALHLAVLREADTVMVKRLLLWKKNLTSEVDKDGSTPLHFVSSMYFSAGALPDFAPLGLYFRIIRVLYRKTTLALPMVFEANPTAVYQADTNGSFPIHVAASAGERSVIEFFCRQCPDSAGLRDARGRTFLHVAVENGKPDVVSYACRDRSLSWIMNMQDNEGNTALHLAIQAGSLWMFCALFGNEGVNLNLINNDGETPLDVSRSKLPWGMGYSLDPEYKIYIALRAPAVGANHSALRRDKAVETYSRRPTPAEEKKESNRLKDATQTLIVASVLIATVAFSATFALPGGYRADDHPNGGTPTLAGSYVFDAFMMATTLAFTFSTIATVGFAFAAAPMFSLITRKVSFVPSLLSMSSSLTCMTIAFALGVYMLLSPVARDTAIAVCFIIPAVLLGPNTTEFLRFVSTARPLFIREGVLQGMNRFLSIAGIALWPFVAIFGWPALVRILRHL